MDALNQSLKRIRALRIVWYALSFTLCLVLFYMVSGDNLRSILIMLSINIVLVLAILAVRKVYYHQIAILKDRYNELKIKNKEKLRIRHLLYSIFNSYDVVFLQGPFNKETGKIAIIVVVNDKIENLELSEEYLKKIFDL